MNVLYLEETNDFPSRKKKSLLMIHDLWARNFNLKDTLMKDTINIPLQTKKGERFSSAKGVKNLKGIWIEEC